MKRFAIKPEIVLCDTCREFCEEYQIGTGDLIFINERNYQRFFETYVSGAIVIYVKKYGEGEPSDEMVEAIYADVKNCHYGRVIAIGGGTIIDVAKLFALETVSPFVDLFDGTTAVKKRKELLIAPTTCGTGSEVTNISILELKTRHTKMGLAKDELFANQAILIPELLEGLPYRFFATSSMDALIHSVESYLSPKANEFTKMYSEKAIQMILHGYKKIAKEGEEARIPLLADFLMASTYAGIAFGNAGCAAVHAMSYPLGARYHVPHGEANYAIFAGVMKTYLQLQPEGDIQTLNEMFKQILGCGNDNLYEKLEKLLDCICPKKALHEYGVSEAELDEFTESVMKSQGRLMANNYTELSNEMVKQIYQRLF